MPQGAANQRWIPTGRRGEYDNMSKSEPNKNMAKSRRHFDETYKRHAVELTLQGSRTVKEIAEELGIDASILYTWRRTYAAEVARNRTSPRTLAEAEAEIAELRAQVVKMRERETILKKSMGILSETPESGMPRLKR